MTLLYCAGASALDGEGASLGFHDWRQLPVRPGDDALELVGQTLRVPRVLSLSRYDGRPRTHVRLTRRNLMLRDDRQCQYCGNRPPLRELNLDHVVPRSRGGRDSWENLVISCRGCNLRKGRKTPEEAGMALLRKPGRPGWSLARLITGSARRQYAEWLPFLGTPRRSADAE